MGYQYVWHLEGLALCDRTAGTAPGRVEQAQAASRQRLRRTTSRSVAAPRSDRQSANDPAIGSVMP